MWLGALGWMIAVIVVVGVAGLLSMRTPMGCGESVEAKVASPLATIRQAIEKYREQHNGKLPTTAIQKELTKATDIDGRFHQRTSTIGPYIRTFPANPINGLATVRCVLGKPRFADDTTGWWYDLSSGEIRANNSGSGPSGVRFSDL